MGIGDTNNQHQPGGEPRDAGAPSSLSGWLLAGAEDCGPEAVGVAAGFQEVAGLPVSGGVGSGVSVTDRVRVLARLRIAVEAELGRVLPAAEAAQVLPHAPVTMLERTAWSRRAAGGLMAAARLADRHSEVAYLWRTGQVDTDVVAALARGVRQVTYAVECQILDAVVPQLPRLSVAGVKQVVAVALDLLHPDDRDAKEQANYDRRGVWVSEHGGMTMITADLPDLEGAAVVACLEAVADSLRVADDPVTTAAQRRADALITVMQKAAAHGDVPATAGGVAVAATITVGATEADRVATGASRPAVTDLTQVVADGGDPAALGTNRTPGGSTTLGDAAVRFALCAGTWTGVLIDDRARRRLPISQALAATHLQPLAVGRSIRLATGYQRIALAVRDGGCLLCDRPPAECQTHHVVDWADGGRTDIDQMVLLCWSHHRQVDLNRWRIVRNTDPSPGAPHWTITPVPRDQWRNKPAAA